MDNIESEKKVEETALEIEKKSLFEGVMRGIRHYAWLLILCLIVTIVIGGAIGFRWWKNRDEEAVVSYWIDEANHSVARGNFEEARISLEWIRKFHSQTWQMDRVLFDLGRLYMDYFGNLDGARFYFTNQMQNHWFSLLTIDSWKKLKEIDFLSDRGTKYEKKVWKEFAFDRRIARAGQRKKALIKMKDLVDSYPQSNVAPNILFTMGEISLKDRGLRSDARKYYGMLKARFPHSPLVEKIPPSELLEQPDKPLEFRDGKRS